MSDAIVKEVVGKGVPVRGNDIDTDRIIPARFLKCVTFDGLGEHAFEDDIDMLKNKGEVHPFRQERFSGASLLVSNVNFGCGSSREHAPQSLMRWGIKAIVAESFSEIFQGNCTALGIPCLTGEHSTVSALQDLIEENPDQVFKVDVSTAQVIAGETVFSFAINEGAQGQFLNGSWNAQESLLKNMSKVKEVAEALPYFRNYAD